MPRKESETPAVFLPGGPEDPLAWEDGLGRHRNLCEDLIDQSESLEDELTQVFVINISDPHTWEYPVYFLVKDKDLGGEAWGVVVIRDVVEWRLFDENFDDEGFERTQIPKHEYDTYVKLFGSLQEWPARVFFKRKKDADNR